MQSQLDEVRHQKKAKFEAVKQREEESQQLARVNNFIFALNDYAETVKQFKRDFFTIFSEDKLTENCENIYQLHLEQLEQRLQQLLTRIDSLPIKVDEHVSQDIKDCLATIQRIRNGIYANIYSRANYSYKQVEDLLEKFLAIKNHLESLCYEYQHKHVAQHESLSTLPAEVFHLILNSLDTKDVLTVARVNKETKDLVDDPIIWKNKLLQRDIVSSNEIKNLTKGFKKIYRKYSKDFDMIFFKNQLTGASKKYQEFINKKKSWEAKEKNFDSLLSATYLGFDVENFKQEIKEELKKYITIDRKNMKYVIIKIASKLSAIFSNAPKESIMSDNDDFNAFGEGAIEKERATAYLWIMSELENVTNLYDANHLIESLESAIQLSANDNGMYLKNRLTKCLAIAKKNVTETNKLLDELKKIPRKPFFDEQEFRDIEKKYDENAKQHIELFKQIINTSFQEFLQNWKNDNTNLYQLCIDSRKNLDTQTKCLTMKQNLADEIRKNEQWYYQTGDEDLVARLQELRDQVEQTGEELNRARKEENELVNKASQLGITYKLSKLSGDINHMFNGKISEAEKVQIMRKTSQKDYDQTMQTLHQQFPDEFLGYLLEDSELALDQIKKEYNQICKR